MLDKVYIVWEKSDDYKIIGIYKDKTKAQEVAGNLRHKMMNDQNIDNSISYDYYCVECYSVN